MKFNEAIQRKVIEFMRQYSCNDLNRNDFEKALCNLKDSFNYIELTSQTPQARAIQTTVLSDVQRTEELPEWLNQLGFIELAALMRAQSHQAQNESHVDASWTEYDENLSQFDHIIALELESYADFFEGVFPETEVLDFFQKILKNCPQKEEWEKLRENSYAKNIMSTDRHFKELIKRR